jgi:hypothetical protein
MPFPSPLLPNVVRASWATAAILLAAALLASCQVYDFEPVTPLALGQTTQVTTLAVTPSKPNLLLLVDKSGSMDLPIEPLKASCRTGPANTSCGQTKAYPCDAGTCETATPDPNACCTRWSTLSSTVGTFLQQNNQSARYGLTFFPEPPSDDVNQQCTPTTSVQAPIPPGTQDSDAAALQALADAARAALASVQSANPMGPTGTGGGTPTGASLGYFVSHPEAVVDRARDAYVLLLTDGLPNCNANLGPTVGTSSCVCTLESDQDCLDARPLGIGCLDDTATVSVISYLQSHLQIATIVLGFGAETALPSAASTLQAMAVAGGFPPRVCPVNPDGGTGQGSCGPTNPCDLGSGLCSKQYYEATDGQSLQQALDTIYSVVGVKACIVPLPETPADQQLISVVVNGTPVLPSDTTWLYQPVGTLPPNLAPNPDGPTLQFFGSLCTEFQNSSKAAPVKLEIRIVTPL